MTEAVPLISELIIYTLKDSPISNRFDKDLQINRFLPTDLVLSGSLGKDIYFCSNAKIPRTAYSPIQKEAIEQILNKGATKNVVDNYLKIGQDFIQNGITGSAMDILNQGSKSLGLISSSDKKLRNVFSQKQFKQRVDCVEYNINIILEILFGNGISYVDNAFGSKKIIANFEWITNKFSVDSLELSGISPLSSFSPFSTNKKEYYNLSIEKGIVITNKNDTKFLWPPSYQFKIPDKNTLNEAFPKLDDIFQFENYNKLQPTKDKSNYLGYIMLACENIGEYNSFNISNFKPTTQNPLWPNPTPRNPIFTLLSLLFLKIFILIL
jgi:hypothetical protein